MEEKKMGYIAIIGAFIAFVTFFEGTKFAKKDGWELYVNPEKGYALLVSDGEVVSLMSGESILELLLERREGN